MRHAHYKLLPHRERARHRVAAHYPAVHLQERRRGRLARSFSSPASIAGLKLWLAGGLGVLGAWHTAPASGAAFVDYSPTSGYTASGYAHTIRIYAYKTVGGARAYSAAYLEVQTFDDSSALNYYLNWSWDAVAGAEGYRILKSDNFSGFSFDHFIDVATTSFVETGPGVFGSASTVTPYELVAASAGDAVVRWIDQSNFGNHATQDAATAQATLQANVLNSRPVLRFGSLAGYSTPLVLNKPCTVFAVYALNGAGDLARRAVSGSNNWLIGPYGPPHEFFNGIAFSGGPALTRGVFVAQAAWQDGSASRNFVNGAFVGATLGAGLGPGTVTLGAGGSFGEPLDGDLAEVIAYDSALSATHRANVWAYLAAKYAL